MVRRLSATSLARRSRLDADRRRAAASAFSAVGRYLVNRLRARARRRLVGATPRRRVCDLDGVARATVVGTVAGVAGDGPAVEVWTDVEGADGDRAVVGRATRPFVLRDRTGEVRVRVPPAGHVAFGGDGATGTVGRGDEVSVTGRVVRGRERGGRRLLTGPRFVVRADTT
ncbi:MULTISPECIES: hypothetical protein [unclassified Haloferax]|uniref:hypothetical protein n=1 Tax=unclassified Haloferax TaxID=2625095 RepID=UPI0028767CCC|nr:MULTISPECIES: hypothetical protein [unclassified Haloferax]MDS0240722.1 hypothetical protein [Haloferax sp. S2CR25]MDS0443843.1 hypothetical protein [Haloferax sp. S2CR25-2]